MDSLPQSQALLAAGFEWLQMAQEAIGFSFTRPTGRVGAHYAEVSEHPKEVYPNPRRASNAALAEQLAAFAKMIPALSSQLDS